MSGAGRASPAILVAVTVARRRDMRRRVIVLAAWCFGCGSAPADADSRVGHTGAPALPASATPAPIAPTAEHPAPTAPMPASPEAPAPVVGAALTSPTPEDRRCPSGMIFIAGGLWRGTRVIPAGERTPRATVGEAVWVQAYCMDETEVTVAAYRRCVEHGRCAAPDATEHCEAARDLESPVDCVRYSDAARYCSLVGKRLPTLAEWKWPAVGREHGWMYPWGDDAPDATVCWSGVAKRRSGCPVTEATRDVSPEGVRGLASNVSELTTTPFGRGRGVYVMGASWSAVDADRVVTWGADWTPVDEPAPEIGFRCVSPLRPRRSRP